MTLIVSLESSTYFDVRDSSLETIRIQPGCLMPLPHILAPLEPASVTGFWQLCSCSDLHKHLVKPKEIKSFPCPHAKAKGDKHYRGS